jgi:hypothetical protein
MMDEPEVLLDLSVAGVMPLAHIRAGNAAKEKPVIALEWQFFKALPILDAEPDAARLRLGHNLVQRFIEVLEEPFLPGLAFLVKLGAKALVFFRLTLSSLDHLEKLVRVVPHVDASAVEHNEPGLNSRSELERLERVLEREFTLTGMFVRELEQIGSRAIDADWQGAEIVKRGNPDLAFVYGLHDSGQQADANSVAQFGVLESQLPDFAQHRAPVRVSV